MVLIRDANMSCYVYLNKYDFKNNISLTFLLNRLSQTITPDSLIYYHP